MDKDYFNSLKNSVQDSERPTSNSSNSLGKAFLTVKIDVDCKLCCDGEFLDLFEANKVKKIPIETGQHLITIESEHYDGVSEDHVVDAAEAGKNYLLLVNGMKQKEAMFRLEQGSQERKLQEREDLMLESEPYAVLSNNNKTLTFYFDNQKKSRKGIDLKTQNWHNYSEEITIVIFDDSFSNCHCIESTEEWFYELGVLTSIKGLYNLHTENVTNMSLMFSGCISLQELDLSNFDTRNVTNMSLMFHACKSLQELDLSNFDTRNVTDMDYMFWGCNSLQKLDLSNFNTRNVTTMGGMFWGCNLQELNLSSFDTRNVTDMASMFRDCNSLQELDLSSFDTRNVTSMSSMFCDCHSLHELDLSSFDTRNVTSMASMFQGCNSLQKLDIRGFNMDKLEFDGNMFEGVNESIIRR